MEGYFYLQCTHALKEYGSPVGNPTKKQFSHGLWQYPRHNNAKRNLASVDVTCFSPRLIKTLRRIMPNLIGDGSLKSDLCLWKHEWEDHGSYLGMTLEEYFLNIEFLYNQLSQNLHVMGLHAGRTFTVQQVQTSMQMHFGVKPELHGKIKHGQTVLIEEFRYMISRMLVYEDSIINYSGAIKSLIDLVMLPS